MARPFRLSVHPRSRTSSTNASKAPQRTPAAGTGAGRCAESHIRTERESSVRVWLAVRRPGPGQAERWLGTGRSKSMRAGLTMHRPQSRRGGEGARERGPRHPHGGGNRADRSPRGVHRQSVLNILACASTRPADRLAALRTFNRARSMPARVRSPSLRTSCSATQEKMASSRSRTGPPVSTHGSRTHRRRRAGMHCCAARA
jgi:hypothetical protein